MTTTSILLAYENGADAATIGGGSYSASFPVTNLGNRRMGKAARTSNDALSSTWFRFKLTAAATLRMIALVRHNLSAAAQWRLRLSSASLDVDFTDGAKTDDRITWGGTGGYTVDSTGALVASSAPRIWFDPVTLACKGLLREPQSTNQLTYSAQIDNAAWVKGGSISVTANQSNGPTKTATMDRLTQVAFADSVYQDVAAAGTSSQTFSIFFRSDTATLTAGRMDLVWLTGGVTQSLQLNYNPTLGASAVVSTNAIGATLVNSGVESWGGGLYRLWISGTGTDAANTVVRVQNYLLGTNGQVMDIGEIGLEARLTPTSPITTTTTAVTRTMDTAVITGASYTALAGSTEGTIYAEVTTTDMTESAAVATAVAVTNAGATNYITIRAVTDPTTPYIDANVIAASVTTWDSANTTTASATTHKAALRYKANDWALYINGASAATNGALALPTGMDRLSLTFAASEPTFLRRITYYPTGLTNQQLDDITTTSPDAIGYNSDWMSVLSMSFYAGTPADWGERHDVQWVNDGQTFQYGIVEIDDTANADGYVQIGRLFAGTVNFQPAANAEIGLGDSHEELSKQTRSRAGEVFSEVLPRPKNVAFRFPSLTEAEGEQLHELQESEGTTEEVYYLPAHETAARQQRYGFLGLMRQLRPVNYAFFATRENAMEMEQKL